MFFVNNSCIVNLILTKQVILLYSVSACHSQCCSDPIVSPVVFPCLSLSVSFLSFSLPALILFPILFLSFSLSFFVYLCVCVCVSLCLSFYLLWHYPTIQWNIQQKEAKDLNVNTKGKNDCCSSIKRIISPAFGKPFMVIGIMHILTSLGVYIIPLFNMINIFKEAQRSVEPQLAPVFVDIVQVGLMLLLCKIW